MSVARHLLLYFVFVGNIARQLVVSESAVGDNNKHIKLSSSFVVSKPENDKILTVSSFIKEDDPKSLFNSEQKDVNINQSPVVKVLPTLIVNNGAAPVYQRYHQLPKVKNNIDRSDQRPASASLFDLESNYSDDQLQTADVIRNPSVFESYQEVPSRPSNPSLFDATFNNPQEETRFNIDPSPPAPPFSQFNSDKQNTITFNSAQLQAMLHPSVDIASILSALNHGSNPSVYRPAPPAPPVVPVGPPAPPVFPVGPPAPPVVPVGPPAPPLPPAPPVVPVGPPAPPLPPAPPVTPVGPPAPPNVIKPTPPSPGAIIGTLTSIVPGVTGLVTGVTGLVPGLSGLVPGLSGLTSLAGLTGLPGITNLLPWPNKVSSAAAPSPLENPAPPAPPPSPAGVYGGYPSYGAPAQNIPEAQGTPAGPTYIIITGLPSQPEYSGNVASQNTPSGPPSYGGSFNPPSSAPSYNGGFNQPSNLPSYVQGLSFNVPSRSPSYSESFSPPLNPPSYVEQLNPPANPAFYDGQFNSQSNPSSYSTSFNPPQDPPSYGVQSNPQMYGASFTPPSNPPSYSGQLTYAVPLNPPSNPPSYSAPLSPPSNPSYLYDSYAPTAVLSPPPSTYSVPQRTAQVRRPLTQASSRDKSKSNKAKSKGKGNSPLNPFRSNSYRLPPASPPSTYGAPPANPPSTYGAPPADPPSTYGAPPAEQDEPQSDSVFENQPQLDIKYDYRYSGPPIVAKGDKASKKFKKLIMKGVIMLGALTAAPIVPAVITGKRKRDLTLNSTAAHKLSSAIMTEQRSDLSLFDSLPYQGAPIPEELRQELAHYMPDKDTITDSECLQKSFCENLIEINDSPYKESLLFFYAV